MLSRSRRLAPLMLATMAAQSLLVVLSPTMVEFGASVGAVGQARAITAASAVASALLVAGVLTDTLSWRAAQAVPAALALAALAAARRVTPVSAVAAPGPRTPWLGVPADRRARRWLLAELAAWFVWAAELTYGGAFLEQPVQGASAAGPATVTGRPGRPRIPAATAPAAGAVR